MSLLIGRDPVHLRTEPFVARLLDCCVYRGLSFVISHAAAADFRVATRAFKPSASTLTLHGPVLGGPATRSSVQAATTHRPLALIASYIASGARSAPLGHATAPSSMRTCRK